MTPTLWPGAGSNFRRALRRPSGNAETQQVVVVAFHTKGDNRQLARLTIQQMLERRGSVFIAPADFFPADGRMVDPACAHFWVSWQNDDGGEGALEDNEVVGAEAAIAWGRKRSAEIWIRLGHRGD